MKFLLAGLPFLPFVKFIANRFPGEQLLARRKILDKNRI